MEETITARRGSRLENRPDLGPRSRSARSTGDVRCRRRLSSRRVGEAEYCAYPMNDQPRILQRSAGLLKEEDAASRVLILCRARWREVSRLAVAERPACQWQHSVVQPGPLVPVSGERRVDEACDVLVSAWKPQVAACISAPAPRGGRTARLGGASRNLTQRSRLTSAAGARLEAQSLPL